MGTAMIAAAIAIVALMLTTWIVSVMIKNASIVDIVWGLGFVVVAWTVRLTVEGDTTRQNLIVVLVTLWGLRLALYLAKRNIGHGEDFRYVLMRRKHGARFPLVSLYTVFAFQGALMWVVSLPVQLGQADDGAPVGPLAVIGVFAWVVGFLFESVGDAQLARFKKDPANAGKVMDRGLWSLTRHPNYFGDAVQWWGIGIVAAEAGTAAIGLIGPAVMTFLLTRVSGVPMLEHSMAKRRPGYEDYVRRTSAFVPRPPRRS
jgi:steroid 5-alpha reductase family enzyme